MLLKRSNWLDSPQGACLVMRSPRTNIANCGHSSRIMVNAGLPRRPHSLRTERLPAALTGMNARLPAPSPAAAIPVIPW